MELCVFAEIDYLLSLSLFLKVPDLLVFFSNMIFIFVTPVIHRELWHSAGLASKEGNATSLSPGFLGGTWGLPNRCEKLSC